MMVYSGHSFLSSPAPFCLHSPGPFLFNSTFIPSGSITVSLSRHSLFPDASSGECLKYWLLRRGLWGVACSSSGWLAGDSWHCGVSQDSVLARAWVVGRKAQERCGERVCHGV